MANESLSMETEADKQEYTFKKVQLLKKETLGTGSYGTVCKAKCDQLICAAKLLYPVLSLQIQAPDPGKEHRQPLCRFEVECRFLSRINHPNIVQYLGTYRDPETNAPVLLMELMDESLTHFLESSPGDIPYHIQVNFSQDIAQALAFLHANGIIHRDLSSNNVLLIVGSRAKVTDFGMSKFADLNASRLATMTTCPGTPAFMSPEALNEPPVYTEKLDTFSLGVLLVQIITRKFPEPTDRFKTMQFPDPQNPSQIIQAMVAIPEVERRQVHISLIEPNHPLLPIALECLKDKDEKRPSSEQLCESLYALKETAKYQESSGKNTTQLHATIDQQPQELTRVKNQQLQQLEKMSQLKEEIEQLRAKLKQAQQENQILDSENSQLKETLEQTKRDSQQEILATTEKLVRLKQQLQLNYEVQATLEQTIAQKDQELRYATRENARICDQYFSIQEIPQPQAIPRSKQPKPYNIPEKRDSVKMVWSTLSKAPSSIQPGSSTEIERNAYFTSSKKIKGKSVTYEFNTTNSTWGELPEHPLTDYTIVTVDNTLTTVGGASKSVFSKSSNQLYSYKKKNWEKLFPAMPTKRTSPGAVSTSHILVVAGGANNGESINTVEIMNISSKGWSTASSLPFSTCQPSVAIHKDYIYLHPRYAFSETDELKPSVVKCSLEDLKLKSRKPKSDNKWKYIHALPLECCSLVAINECLLAVGGKTPISSGFYTLKESKKIHKYNEATDSWEVVSEMIEGRSSSLTAIHPGNKLMVVGGDKNDTKLDVGIFL